jgi:CDP-glucose 4,6-dehydratase
LEGIVAWHRAWLSGADMHDHCNAELERFVRTPLAHAA